MKSSAVILLWGSLLLSVATPFARADFAAPSITASTQHETILERRREVERFEAKKLEDRDRRYEQVSRDAYFQQGFPWQTAGGFATCVLLVAIPLFLRRKRTSQVLAVSQIPRSIRSQPRLNPQAGAQNQAAAGALLSVLSMLRPSFKRRHRRRHRNHRHHRSHRHHHRSDSNPSSSESSS